VFNDVAIEEVRIEVMLLPPKETLLDREEQGKDRRLECRAANFTWETLAIP
jgi:hypothetical protein